MKKFSILVALFLLIVTNFAFSAEDKVPVFLVKVPLSDEVRSFGVESCKSYQDMDSPFAGGYCDAKEMPFCSMNPEDYEISPPDANLLLRSVDEVEKRESDGITFFSVKFTYQIFRGDKLAKKYEFTTIGAAEQAESALETCFKNAAVHASAIAGEVSEDGKRFYVAGVLPYEYVLNCGKKDRIKKGDEFRLFSKRSGLCIGRLFATDVLDDKTFAQRLNLKEKPLAGDIATHRRTIGLGSNFYYGRIFGDNLNCVGFYEEYSRGLRAFRPIVGAEWVGGLDDDAWNLYAGLKTTWRFGWSNLSSVVSVGRGEVGGEFCYTGGSIKLLASAAPVEWLRFGIECGYTKWIADHDDEFDDYGGFVLGGGLTLRY